MSQPSTRLPASPVAADATRCAVPFVVLAAVLSGSLAGTPLLADEIVGIDILEGADALNPPFDPGVARYSIVLDADTAARISVRTREGSPVNIGGRWYPSGESVALEGMAPGTRLSLWSAPDANGAAASRPDTDADATPSHGARAPEHELVLLPPDFPALRTTVLESEASEAPLFVTLFDPPASFLAKLDNHGVPLFYRRDEREVFDFRFHALTGEYSYARRTGEHNARGRAQTERVVLDARFEEVARLGTSGLSHTGHHEFLTLPDGLALMMAYHGRADEKGIEDSLFQLLSREDGAVVFEWSTRDHVGVDEQTYPVPDDEYAHLNAVSIDDDGHYLASFRGLSQVLKIASDSGEVLWRLGGKRGDFRFVDDPLGGFCGQHLPTRLDNGNLLLFDNGQNCWPPATERGERTRVLEYRLDTEAMEAHLVWSHEREDAYAQRQGSAQRLANGNTLIGWGYGPDVLVSEVNPDGRTVFELVVRGNDESPVHGYRAYRFAD